MDKTIKELSSEQLRQEIEQVERQLAVCNAEYTKTSKELSTLAREFNTNIAGAKKEQTRLENLLKDPSTLDSDEVLSAQHKLSEAVVKVAELREAREGKLAEYTQKKQDLKTQEDELKARLDYLERVLLEVEEREAEEKKRERELQELLSKRNREREIGELAAQRDRQAKQGGKAVPNKAVPSDKGYYPPVTGHNNKVPAQTSGKQKSTPPKATTSTPIVSEKLVAKSKKAHEELNKAKEILSVVDEAETIAREERRRAGKKVAVAGAKILEAVDTAEVAEKRLNEKHTAGVGARVDAVRATTNVEIAETEYKQKEYEYKEKQVKVAKLSVTSDILDLKAEMKTLEAETIDLAIAKSQLHGIGTEYGVKKAIENPTEEDLQDIETLEVLFEGLKGSIARLEARMETRAGRIKLKEANLTEEALAEINKDIKADEEEYLDLAKSVRQTSIETNNSIQEAQEQEYKLVQQLENLEKSPNNFLSQHKDSELLKGLKEAQSLKNSVLKVGTELFEKRIEEAEENLASNINKGQDTVLSAQSLEELTELRSKIRTTKAVALTVSSLSKASSIGAEGFKLAGDTLGLATDTLAEAAGTATDLMANVAGLSPVGQSLHIGLHITAGIERASGHVLAGLERAVGETLRGEVRINTEGVAAEAIMGSEASQLGLTDTEGMARMSGMRHGEVERQIAFDRVGYVMAETGEKVVGDILGTLEKVGIPVKALGTLIGDEGLGNLFLQGMDEKGVFESHGDIAIDVRASLGAFFGGDDITKYLNNLGGTTAIRAGSEGFIGGLFSGFSKAGLMQGETAEDFAKALQSSRNTSKVRPDYLYDPEGKDTADGFLDSKNAIQNATYANWFETDGDKEEAQRIAAQKSPNLLGEFRKQTDNEENTGDYKGDGEGEGASDNIDEDDTSLDGTGTPPDRVGWMRTPYGSLVRGTNRAEGKKVLSALQSRTKKIGLKAEDLVLNFKNKKKKTRRRILMSIMALILLVVLFIQLILAPLLVGLLGGIINFHNNGIWGGKDCTCGCLEQFYELNGEGGEDVGGLPDSSDYSDIVHNGVTPTGYKVFKDAQIEKIKKYQPYYMEAGEIHDIPWQVMAVIHVRESNLGIRNPANGQGIYQLYSHVAAYPNAFPPTSGDVSMEEFREQTIFAAQYAKAKNKNLTAAGEHDEIMRLFFGFNGVSPKYLKQARDLGFTQAEAKLGHGSPYVVNRIDAKRDPDTAAPGTWGQIKTDSGPLIYPANKDAGAFVMYLALSGGLGGEVVETPETPETPTTPNPEESPVVSTLPKITFIGDSIGVGLEPYIREKITADSIIDAVVGRGVSIAPEETAGSTAQAVSPYLSGRDAYKSYIEANTLGNSVVIQLGTTSGNSDTTGLESMLSELPSGKRAIIVTPYIKNDEVGDGGISEVITWARGLGNKADIVDWAKAVETNPQLLSADGVHPTEDGYAKLAELLLGVLTAAAPENGAQGTTGANTIVCDCPLDCSCWDIHGTGPNIVRSDGSSVFPDGSDTPSEDNNNELIIPDGVPPIVAVAQAEVARAEGYTGTDPIGKKYWDAIYNGNPANWCGIFVSWCANEVGAMTPDIVPYYPGVQVGRQKFIALGVYHSKESGYRPKPGDLIFLTRPNHTGIVESADDEYVYTIEGNTGNNNLRKSTVARRKHAYTSSRLQGFASPNYQTTVTPEVPEP